MQQLLDRLKVPGTLGVNTERSSLLLSDFHQADLISLHAPRHREAANLILGSQLAGIVGQSVTFI